MSAQDNLIQIAVSKLQTGYLSPDRKNLLYFTGMAGIVSVVALVAYSAGFQAGSTNNHQINEVKKHLNAVIDEQASRTVHFQ